MAGAAAKTCAIASWGRVTAIRPHMLRPPRCLRQAYGLKAGMKRGANCARKAIGGMTGLSPNRLCIASKIQSMPPCILHAVKTELIRQSCQFTGRQRENLTILGRASCYFFETQSRRLTEMSPRKIGPLCFRFGNKAVEIFEQYRCCACLSHPNSTRKTLAILEAAWQKFRLREYQHWGMI